MHIEHRLVIILALSIFAVAIISNGQQTPGESCGCCECSIRILEEKNATDSDKAITSLNVTNDQLSCQHPGPTECAKICSSALLLATQNGSLFVNYPGRNETLGQVLCDIISDVEDKYIGVFGDLKCTNETDVVVFSNMTFREKLCCYSKEQTACPDDSVYAAPTDQPLKLH